MKNKIRFKTLLVILAVLICVPLTVLSHGGRTDSSGGHRDNKNVSGLGGIIVIILVAATIAVLYNLSEIKRFSQPIHMREPNYIER